MKRLTVTISTVLLLVLSLPTVALANPLGPGPGDPDPVVQPSDPGDYIPPGDGEGEAPPPEEPRVPQLLTYTPVVTVLHSVNAGLASDGNAVYFMPQLEDFPVDLADSCAEVTTDDGKVHKFAIVYDGRFDTEVAYQLAQNDNNDGSGVSRLQTSKKVYSQTDNSRALNLLGYDLLLSDERCSLYNQGGYVNASYSPTLVGTAPITTKTAVMDLYKAVGVYEWDIKVIYGIDEELEVNTSPLMQQIAVLTNDEVEGGIDTEEGATWVWASRTNPDIYWTRAKRDAIFDGGAHLYTKPVYIGNNVSVSFAKNETQTLSMGEFCQLARAIMELYGEPVLTEAEIECMIQTYALVLPVSDMPEEQMEAIRYLSAKGIIDPSTLNWSQQVTFADIEEILLRIADEGSRLTFKYTSNPDNAMARAGYAKVPVATTDVGFDNVEEIVNPYDSDYYDYFVEAVNGYTNFYLEKLSGVDLLGQGNLVGDENDPDKYGSEAPSNNKLTIIGDSISAYSGYDSGSSYYPASDVSSVSQMWYGIIAQRGGYQLSTVASNSGCLVERIPATAAGQVSGVMQATSHIDATAGTTAVFVGTNDVLQGTPVDEFETSYKKMLSIIRERNPDTKLVCITPYVSGSSAYNEAILRAAQEYSAGICNPSMPSTVGDNVHPNADGMQTLATSCYANFGKATSTPKPTQPTTGDGTGTIPTEQLTQEAKTFAFACDKLMVAGADSIATTPGSGYFEYLGLTEYADRWYYHFKISRTLSSITITYDVDPTLEKLLNGFESYTLESAEGGVYNYSDDLPTHMTFDEAVFSYEYIDAPRVEEDVHELADTESYLSQYTWIKVDYRTDKWNEKVKGTAAESAILKYSQNGKTFTVTAKDLDEARQTNARRFEDPAGNVWWCHESMQEYGIDYIIWVCQTKMSAADFKKALVADAKISSTKESKAYYRAEDGTLLASYDYLKRQGLCSGIQSLRAGSGVMLATKGGNVSLRDDLDLVIVGDTVIPAKGELLYYKEGEDYYINVKACLGWSDDYVIINNQNALIPLFRENKANSSVKRSTTTKSVMSYFPSASVSVPYSKLKTINYKDGLGEGISLSGTNPLGCYLVVYDTDHDTDWLFVWHRNDVKDSSGGTHTVDEGDARSKFQSLTGVSVCSVSSEYSLKCFQLNRNNVGNPAGIKYLYYDYLANYSAGRATFGYVYNPPTFSDINSALNTYITGSEACALPIATVDGKYVNLNLNTCTDMEGNEQLPIGTLPMNMHSSSKSSADKMGTIKSNGRSVEASSATYDNLDSVKILTAPVGLFQVIKGLGTRSVAQWTSNSGTLFFGSSRCKLNGSQITVGSRALEFDTNVDAVCTLLSSGVSSVYVINEDSSSLGAILEEKLEEFGVIVTDPETLIDWSAYKFHRLVQNMDSWTTILLIFVLNVLPRVGMLLFFVLMLFSLIKDVKFWRSFCVNHFDVYSFLTMGKQNVDTVDMKRVVLISLICFSVFLIIMDGQLFNFIIFICRLFVNITQR